ncbi:MAG: ROK family protein [Cetobacterium sp.]|uniref:ROK family protein n=1 Tax=Cetobacterium sp. TaxID=2071632 RepID=UPI003F3687D0
MTNYLSFDVGGTNTKFGILNDKGEIILKDKIPTPKEKDAFFNKIKEIAAEYVDEYKIKGIGFSMPGIIDVEKGYTVTSGALSNLYNCYMKDELEKLTGLKVTLENDVNCVALAEKWIGNGKDEKNFISIAIGTGIGGAVIINDSLYRGSKYMAGEFGFMLAKDIENKNSRMSTLSLIASTATGIVGAYRELTGKDLSGEEISKLCKEKEINAVKVFDEFYNYIASGIFNLIFAFDPGKVLIGGAISSDSMIMSGIINRINEIKKMNPDLNNLEFPKIEDCKFNNDSGIIGAVYNFIKENEVENEKR